MVSPLPVGYSAILAQLKLSLIPHYRASFIMEQGRGSTVQKGDITFVYYPKNYAIADPDNPFLQMEFALKHDGVNLAILSQVFQKIDNVALTSFIREKPNGKYRRIIWFLFEYLMQEKLELPDLKDVNYVPLLDENKYYIGPARKSKRHAVINNLLGHDTFSPIVRKTEKLNEYCHLGLEKQANNLLSTVEPNVLARAMHYLYTKETKSSFGIEHVTPSRTRLERFIRLLEGVRDIEQIDKNILIKLQNAIVEDPYHDESYRKTQNYVAEMTRLYEQKLHYISPRPEDIEELMTDLIAFEHNMQTLDCHPVIIASIIAFQFVFIHPFEDGNGRIHRFLIHYVLSKLGFTPEHIIFPVSSVMLKAIRDYDGILESFSKPLMTCIDEYQLSDEGVLQVSSKTKHFYQYIDYTQIAEYVFACVEKTIEEDFKEEIEFIQKYDKTKSAIQNIIDMPDVKVDRIIKCIAENEGKLGIKMRKTVFQELNNDVITLIEDVVKQNMLN